MVCDLTGLDISNASLLDEQPQPPKPWPWRSARPSRRPDLLRRPQLPPADHRAPENPRRTLRLVDQGRRSAEGSDARAVFGAIFQYPGTYGHVHDFTPQIEALHQAQALAVVAADPLALALLKSPAKWRGHRHRLDPALRRADGLRRPACGLHGGEGCAEALMPGRIVGVSVDARGKRAYRLSLQTREQHIPPRKGDVEHLHRAGPARGHGLHVCRLPWPKGLKAIAQSVHQKTVRLAEGLEKLGLKVEPETLFDTITVDVGGLQKVILKAAVAEALTCAPSAIRRSASRWMSAPAPGRWKPSGAFGGDMTVDEAKTPEWRLPEKTCARPSI